MTAISGTRRQYKEMADGTLRVQIDIDPMFKQQFLEIFGSIDMPVALAPLNVDFEQPKKEEKPKGGPLAKSAGQMCNYPPFQQFIRERHRYHAEPLQPENSYATSALRYICGIESRVELDHKPKAAKRFHELMHEYKVWNEGNESAKAKSP